MSDEYPVSLVLDRSALLAYLSGSMHVAEPIHLATTVMACVEHRAPILTGEPPQYGDWGLPLIHIPPA